MAVDREDLCVVIDHDFVVVAAAGNAAGAHAASDDGSVAGHAAAHGQDALRNLHADDVFGAGLKTDEHNLLPVGVLDLLFGVFGAEDDAAASRTRGSGQALANGLGGLEGGGIKLRVQQGVELLGLHAQHSGALIDHAFVHEVAGNLKRGLGGTLAVTGLQHEELAILDGELHVLHILIVRFEAVRDLDKLVVDLGHFLMQLADGGRGADAGDDVLALGVDEVLAHELLLAGGGVAGEGDAGGPNACPSCRTPSAGR